jgi:RNA methyltransferase, TrmH family
MPLIGAIQSLQNPHIKLVRRLQNKRRDRYRERQYVAEGFRLVQHVVARGHRPALVFVSTGFANQGWSDLIDTLVAGDCPVWEVSGEVMAAMSDTVTPQGILAVLPLPEPDPQRIAQSDLVLVVEGWRIPGNLGTVLRTALATGVGGVICSPGTVDPYAPKVVRGAMGAHLDLAILPDLSWDQIASLVADRQCILADAAGPTTLWDLDWTVPTALIVGSEARGPGTEAQTLATPVARIPMAEGAESLNAAIATAAFLFEAQRQRHVAQG